MITWQPMFETGVPLIDEQHRKLVGMINRLDDALKQGESGIHREIGRVLEALVEYTQKHFADEEKIQEEISYAGLKKHKEQHNDLKKQIIAVLLRLKKGGTINACELKAFLQNWLINHILTEDKKIGEAFAKKTAAAR